MKCGPCTREVATSPSCPHSLPPPGRLVREEHVLPCLLGALVVWQEIKIEPLLCEPVDMKLSFKQSQVRAASHSWNLEGGRTLTQEQMEAPLHPRAS